MLNVATKFRSLAIIAIVGSACGSMLWSCSDPQKKEAEQMLVSAQEAYDSGFYQQAIDLLDSIDTKYPRQIKVRRSGMSLRPKALEKITLEMLEETDSLLAFAEVNAEAMKNVLSFVEHPIEGYYVSSRLKDADPSKAEGIYARMSPEGLFYIVSSANKGTLSTSITLTSENESATSATVEYDGERNDRSMEREMITFMQGECDTIGHFSLTHAMHPVSLTFGGGKPHTIKLSPEQVAAVAEVYGASQLYNRIKLLRIQKSHLEQQLTLTRSQIARTFREEE
ncbi:MAG: hypothetical protein K2M01_03450 [Paramuribaculum sp.]|nr:hypothetical protein [Paramuribaculum sp.]